MNRFHNKYHRHNHHSKPTAGEPDSAHDPIASKESPFKGEFHVDGQLSAISASVNDLSVTNNLTVSGKATFKGPIDIHLPISTIYEHLMIVPKLTTPDYYFKIDSNFTDYPLMEVYLNGSSVFMITTGKDVGIGTNAPEAKLDVRGDIKCFNLSAINIIGTGNLTISGGSHFNSITADNTSRIGYLEIGYTPNQETYLKTLSSNYDLWFYTNSTLNLKMHQTGNNYFPGKVGIGMEPVEALTLSGQMGFRTNGLALLDNSYTDTLRVITNRDGDDDQHLFTFTYDGRYVVGDIFHDFTYPIGAAGTCGWGAVNSGKVNIVETRGEGRALHITTFNNEPIIRLYRVNNSPSDPAAVKVDETIGGLFAFGYNKDTCYGDRNAALRFAAANNFLGTTQGAYTFFENTCASDIGNNLRETIRIDHNGNFGINTKNTALTPTTLPYRNTIRPEWKFTVRDFDTETRPAAVIFAGVSASPMMQIIGGEGQLEQTALMLSDRNINDANTNHIEFTHGAGDVRIARVSSLNRGAEGANGGSLLFSTTHGKLVGSTPTYSGMIFDPATGDIVASDWTNHIIVRFPAADLAAGNVTPVVIAGITATSGNIDGPSLTAKFNRPEGVCIDNFGNIYVADYSNGLIRRIDTAGVVTTIATIAGSPDDIIFVPTTSPARAGNLIVAIGSRVLEMSTAGVIVNTFSVGDRIEGVAVDAAGNIYAADANKHVIRIIDTAGVVSVYAGVSGTAGGTNGARIGAATFNTPFKIVIDAAGNIYVGHMSSGATIRRIDTGGNVTDYTSPGRTVYYMAIDGAGNIYTTPDSSTNTIIVAEATGTTRTINVNVTTTSVSPLPFERARINYDGDMGIGIKLPNSRLHIHDDDKRHIQAAGSLRDVVTVSTLNNTNGILLSSVDLLSRIYNNNSKKELHITTSTTDGKIKFGSDNEKFAAVITPKQKVGINIDEIIDTDVNHLNTWALSAENVKLVVNGDTIMCNVTSTSAGGRLYFNRELSAVNTDPIYIFRHDNIHDVSELRINIGDNTCSVPAGGTATLDAKYINEDVFSIGNYPWTGTGPSLDWNRWVDVGACSTVLYNNLSVQGDATFDKDVTIKGSLSVVSPSGVPTVFRGDLYIDGNIFATGDITGFCGCAPPAYIDGSGRPIPAGWAWDPACTGTHPPSAALPVPCPSDIRLKLNIEPITDSVGKIMQISGNTFIWDETKQSTHKGKDVGVIAQEIEKILPEIVHEDSRGYKNVQYEKIIPLLVECIKELKKEIDLLKSI